MAKRELPSPATQPTKARHPYGFPFPPYGLQLQLMNDLTRCLDDGGVGVFESPTGTGKSLSLLCAALRWQLDQQEREQDAKLLAPAADDGELAWVAEQAHEQRAARVRASADALVDARRKRAKRLAAYLAGSVSRRANIAHASGRYARPGAATMAGASAVPGRAAAGEAAPDADADSFATLAAWEAGGEGEEERRQRALDLTDESESDDERDTSVQPWRVLYCSRTHSQLAQVVGEVRKTSYGERISVVSLAGRRALCTNEAVRGLGSTDRINEACLEMLGKKPTKKASSTREEMPEDGGPARRGTATTRAERTHASSSAGGGCPHHTSGSASQSAARQALGDRMLNEPLDVEDLAQMGRTEGCCAYYATRAALPEAQLVLLPYASLLHESTRASLGISLKRSVVIIDEAHNLIDTINETHSVTLTGRQLSEVSAQLAQYAERYHARLKPSNRHCVQQLLHVVRALRKALLPPSCREGGAANPPVSERVVRMNTFLCSLNIDHLNLFTLQAFCDGSQIAKKLRGFAEAQVQTQAQSSSGNGAVRASLHGVIRVLDALTNVDADARVLLHIESPTAAPAAACVTGQAPATAADGSWLRVLHLNPAVYFSRVLAEAHSVILAGGTMQPFADLEQQLFRDLPAGRLRVHSYGHVVPPANLLPVVLGSGPSGNPLQLTFANRSAPAMMDEVGRILLALARVVPDGIVAFVPSFSYEEQLVAHLKASGMWARLGGLKTLFREPREAHELDRVLKAYAATIDANFESACDHSGAVDADANPARHGARGALLLSVVGGKMSEGINFSDGLGRCVVMLGMPFANTSEMTLQERMAHLDATQGAGAGREYYINLCMKAVNQSVGRAIRHVRDYAAIVLVDLRFGRASVRSRLPSWIGEQLRTPSSGGQAIHAVRTFFDGRAAEQHAIEQERARRYEGKVEQVP